MNFEKPNIEGSGMTREEYEKCDHLGGTKVDPETGLIHDYLNAWMGVHLGLQNPERELVLDYIFSPIKSYEEYLDKDEKMQSFAPFIMEDTDLESLQKINMLVEQFNAELPEMRESRNYDRAEEILKKVFTLVKGI